ncbi:50e29e60-b026-4c21-b34c-af24b74ad431 [Sclerotinia trifoliorum]|uniref:50e29e60-b026-4c21-b34c-af24b74ad431 n=1 Tax=Sclerotinia trifoliorum TaxID=28548 RepID=A0A8H2VNZ9_9HELO|nr:50e29e60-b026-4c21-b34c-af24b74ad431 [Sclerotinia trifoliorum]
MPQSLSSSMQGYYGSEKAVEDIPHATASMKKQPQNPFSLSYNLSRFTSVNSAPPLAFREPVPLAERISGARHTIKDFDAKMSRG